MPLICCCWCFWFRGHVKKTVDDQCNRVTSHRHRAARAGTNQIMDLSHWLACPNSHILIGCKSCRWNRIELLGCAARTLCRDAFRERSVLQGKPKCSTHRNIELLYPYSQRFIGGNILGISEHWGGLVPPNVYGRYAYELTTHTG